MIHSIRKASEINNKKIERERDLKRERKKETFESSKIDAMK